MPTVCSCIALCVVYMNSIVLDPCLWVYISSNKPWNGQFKFIDPKHIVQNYNTTFIYIRALCGALKIIVEKTLNAFTICTHSQFRVMTCIHNKNGKRQNIQRLSFDHVISESVIEWRQSFFLDYVLIQLTDSVWCLFVCLIWFEIARQENRNINV